MFGVEIERIGLWRDTASGAGGTDASLGGAARHAPPGHRVPPRRRGRTLFTSTTPGHNDSHRRVARANEMFLHLVSMPHFDDTKSTRGRRLCGTCRGRHPHAALVSSGPRLRRASDCRARAMSRRPTCCLMETSSSCTPTALARSSTFARNPGSSSRSSMPSRRRRSRSIAHVECDLGQSAVERRRLEIEIWRKTARGGRASWAKR